MTEYEALTLANEYVEKAMEALRAYEGDSFAADEAFEGLMHAGYKLDQGLKIIRSEDLMSVTWSWPASEVYGGERENETPVFTPVGS